MNRILVLTILLCNTAFAKDYGIKGNTFEIAEEDLLLAIQKSLSKFDVQGFQKKITQEAKKSINRPKGVFLPKAHKNSTRTFDPSIILNTDLKDHTGKVFAVRGTKLNPLKYIKLRETLIFIDGDDKQQVEFALNFKGEKQIILTKGEVLSLNKTHNAMFFFDFNGGLIKRFEIIRLPSVVLQKGELLEINEIAL